MLTIYGHPISSFTWKVLAALYENDTPFEFVTVDQNTYAGFHSEVAARQRFRSWSIAIAIGSSPRRA
jgi:glutathione S-transferase